MSTNTGIKPNQEVLDFFATSKDGSVRLIKLGVQDEQLVLFDSKAPSGSWAEDYDRLVLPMLDDKSPCYILYRLDSVNPLGYEWLFINWVPDTSPVREKMLYAGTRATLRQEFGDGHILDTLHGTEPKEVSYEGYEVHKRSKEAPPPLTMAEYEMEEVIANEISHTGLDSGELTMKGLYFPLTDEAVAMVRQFAAGQLNYMQLKIDSSAEVISSAFPAAQLSLAELPPHIFTDELGYHLFRWIHNFEGAHLESVIFIYALSGYKSPIKSRMLYSSCKNTLISILENHYKIQFARKMETEDPSDLTEENFMNGLHPPKAETKKLKFDKPVGPKGGRGPRRLIK